MFKGLLQWIWEVRDLMWRKPNQSRTGFVTATYTENISDMERKSNGIIYVQQKSQRETIKHRLLSKGGNLKFSIANHKQNSSCHSIMNMHYSNKAVFRHLCLIANHRKTNVTSMCDGIRSSDVGLKN